MSSTTSKKQVHFLPENDMVIEIKYNKQDIQDSWYTKSQLETIGMTRTAVALRWEAGNQPSSFCIRGLERFTQQWGGRIERNIERCVDAVICEQKANWSTGGDECDLLAAVSQEASKCSVQQALARAQEDRLEALKAYKPQSRIRNAFMRPILGIL